jgi:hypothetical protein
MSETVEMPVLEALAELLSYTEANECAHEETHRGGYLWTICGNCGRKWADDEGGFQPYVEPEPIATARRILARPGPAETLAIFDGAARARHYEDLWERGEADLASLRTRIAELEAGHKDLNAAIDYALDDIPGSDGLEWLRLWREGDPAATSELYDFSDPDRARALLEERSDPCAPSDRSEQ